MARGVTHVVIDASVGVAAVLSLPYSREAEALLRRLGRSEIHVPTLWEYEVVSTLRKSMALGRSTPEEAERALDRLLALDVERIAPDEALHRSALRWAARLGQVAAYDAQYLALAERLHAPFWTADRRLARQATGIGVDWVHAIGSD